MPATMTNSTTNSLSATSTRLTRSDSLIPMVMSTPRTTTSTIDGTSTTPPYADRVGDREAEVVEQHPEVRAPALRDDAGTQEHLEDEVPPDDPREDLAEARVAERVRRPRDRDGRGELRVAHRRERAADRREDERQDDARAGDVVGRPPGEREDAGADDHADAEHDQVERAQRALELELRLLGVRHGLLDGLGAQHAHDGSPDVARVVRRVWRNLRRRARRKRPGRRRQPPVSEKCW